MKPTVFLQDACLKHRYIRDNDLSAIVERPERLRALCLGIACATARLESLSKKEPLVNESSKEKIDSSLSDALQALNIGDSRPLSTCSALRIIRSTASLNLLEYPAVIFAHDQAHIKRILTLSRDSQSTISQGNCEIPQELPKGDLYLCPESIDAIQGAAATVCEAVDFVMGSKQDLGRAFVGVRPPGHHCGDDSPSGFCWVNNVAIGAAHAYIKHGVKKVVIFDIDLHHGNGTQAIAWSINEETYRKTLEREAGAKIQDPGPQIFYGSLHDILSYPCESGDASLVQAASVSIHGSHGQHIENIHLEPYQSEAHFYGVLYKEKYSRLLTKAKEFVQGNAPCGKDEVLFFISCGFDACEHEYKSMSRHGCKVPVGFYQKFTQDVCVLADDLGGSVGTGRVVSVLEGGYSDRAIISGSIAHLVGLSSVTPLSESPEIDFASWWQVDNLAKLEDAMKKRRNPASNESSEPWLDRTLMLFYDLAGRKPKPVAPTSTRQLRERKPKQLADNNSTTQAGHEPESKAKPHKEEGRDPGSTDVIPVVAMATTTKKLPKVTLRLGPRPSLEADRKGE